MSMCKRIGNWRALSLALACHFALLAGSRAGDRFFPQATSLPEAGSLNLRLLTPRLLEIRSIASRKSFAEPLSDWAALEKKDFSLEIPAPDAFEVRAAGKEIRVRQAGLRRLPIYAAYDKFDLRLLQQLFLELGDPVPEGATVEVTDRSGKFWPHPLTADNSPERHSPAIHFSRFGYAPPAPKSAFVSYDLGSLGEMDLPGPAEARIVDQKGQIVFEGPLERQTEKDWIWHQKVWRLDFSALTTPGRYRIEVPGLGRSEEFLIDGAAPAMAARLLALGLYHQRSGFAKAPPFTRFAHPASHLRPAEIPTDGPEFKATNKHLADMAKKNTDPEKQNAPILDQVGKSLYPFVRQGTVDVSGGHYDAGDYSKYVINSAQLIHALVLATDHFPGVAGLDNLGLPESGDGVPDALQIAIHEARFLLKMQDEDGGFYFLVYPRNRAYELDVLPEDGDPQVVFPKNTAATAACTGALAQLAGSPALLRHDPALAGKCLAAGIRGYAFLKKAIANHGFDGSYQAISHYGNYDAHRDELCYAAASLFVATGERKYEDDLMSWWPDPLDGRDKKWGWLPLYESYGSAARVYGLAEKSGLLSAGTCRPAYLAKMQTVLQQAAETHLALSRANAYGLPLSLSSKRRAQAGWFWAMDPALDVLCASLLEPDATKREELLRAIALWAAYEAGGNPMDRALISGGGPVWRREAVNRISLNDDRRLAAPGIPIGNVVSTPHNLKPFQIAGTNGLRKQFFPALDRFAFYDRSQTDAYNVKEEWSVATGARLLAGHLFLMGRSPSALQPWKPIPVQIEGLPERVRKGETIHARIAWPDGLSPKDAMIVWELIGSEPVTGREFSAQAMTPGPARLEAEVVWPDGRRVSVVRRFEIVPG